MCLWTNNKCENYSIIQGEVQRDLGHLKKLNRDQMAGLVSRIKHMQVSYLCHF